MIVIVTYEISYRSTLLGKLVKVLGSPDSLLLIASNYVGSYPKIAVEKPSGHDPLKNALAYIFKQIKMSYHILRNRRETSWTLFFIGGSVLVLPMITSKVVGKKIALMATGSASKSYKHMGGSTNNLNSLILSILEKINYSLCDLLIVESASVVNFLGLQNYQEKIVINSLSIDERFSRVVPYGERGSTIGFIGRLSLEKGIRQFVETIPMITDLKFDFFIVGDGDEKQMVEEFVGEKGLTERVHLTGNVDTKQVIDVLNSLKLLVLPSFSEGLPNIVLEAMACGTPVLATRVGGIPDVIEDGVNGFLVDGNEPDQLSTAIRNTMARDDLADISFAAESFIRINYSDEPVIKKWNEMIKLLTGSG